ncbi:MAG: cytochrome c [Anaerolineae bacterium]|nr:cytochrome c [Anaerolineae bacterium]MCB0178224.1 cytochrome c [Anaerolineae bacterium]MCB0223817.1 cytochrome c [Anaerolineae bacterium]MCB9104070.1 cytochrome c [Anaerolineales bacterium]
MSKTVNKSLFGITLLIFLALLTSGCDLIPGRHMRDQPKLKPLAASTLFDNRRASQIPPANTVPRGEWYEFMSDEPFYTGRQNGEFIDIIPIEVNREVLLRGQERFNIYCSPCHGLVGNGQGMVVQRGFKQPNSFHTDQVRSQPDGYFYDVMTNGFGVMYSYAARVHPEDRWAIVAYIRALQFSQNVPLDSLPTEDRQQIESLVE